MQWLSPLLRGFAAVLSPRVASSVHTAQPQQTLQHEQMHEWQQWQAEQPRHAAVRDAHASECAHGPELRVAQPPLHHGTQTQPRLMVYRPRNMHEASQAASAPAHARSLRTPPEPSADELSNLRAAHPALDAHANSPAARLRTRIDPEASLVESLRTAG